MIQIITGKRLKPKKWWMAGLMTLCACNGYLERYPDPLPAPVHRQDGYKDNGTEPPGSLNQDTGMSIMNNGMILMLGMLDLPDYKDSTVVYTSSRFTRP